MTTFGQLRSKRIVQQTLPTEPVAGDFFFRSDTNQLIVYNGTQWVFAQLSTTTSTSTSTTTTSTSTTTTSTSSSTSTSTSSSTTTSTTTTL